MENNKTFGELRPGDQVWVLNIQGHLNPVPVKIERLKVLNIGSSVILGRTVRVYSIESFDNPIYFNYHSLDSTCYLLPFGIITPNTWEALEWFGNYIVGNRLEVTREIIIKYFKILQEAHDEDIQRS